MSYAEQWSQAAVAGGPRAGFWQRFWAALIDGLLIGAVAGAVTLALKHESYLPGLLIGLAYFTLCEGGPGGQTLGKRALGIRVVDQHTGEAIGYGRASVRYLGRAISAIVFYLGYLWMLWDPERQCWHDKFAADVVVPASVYPPPAWGGRRRG